MHLNWLDELNLVEAFLRGKGGILHVRAGEHCMPSAFINAVRNLARAMPKPMNAAMLNPNNQMTASPLTAFKEIARQIAQSGPFHPPEAPISITTASDLRSIFGNVTVSNVTVINGPASEPDELRGLTDLLKSEIDRGRTFHDLLIIFQDCQDMDSTVLRDFYYTLWQSALAEAVAHGAKAIFQYNHSGMDVNLHSIPPIADCTVDLPATLSGVEEELAELAVDHEWEESLHDARVLARTVLDTSLSVRDVYSSMALLGMRKARLG